MSTRINSKRKFNITIAEAGQSYMDAQTLERLLTPAGNDFEYIYAIGEIIDEVLDLKNGEAMYFQPNRDNKLAKGIIQRYQ